MLPVQQPLEIGLGGSRHSSGRSPPLAIRASSRFGLLSALPQYLRRTTRFSQMDMEYTFSQMVYLCKSPSEVYKLVKWRKQTKNQWARDDPGFVVIQMLMITASTMAYWLGFGGGAQSFGLVPLLLWSYFQVLGVGALVATAGSAVANRYMRIDLRHGQHTVEQKVEWLYAFDIHCNSFFPLFLLLHVVQYFLSPALIGQGFVAAILSNTLYSAAYLAYVGKEGGSHYREGGGRLSL